MTAYTQNGDSSLQTNNGLESVLVVEIHLQGIQQLTRVRRSYKMRAHWSKMACDDHEEEQAIPLWASVGCMLPLYNHHLHTGEGVR